MWEPTLIQVSPLFFTVEDFPERFHIDIENEIGFETYLFNELNISKYENLKEEKFENLVQFKFVCAQPNKYWEGTWELSTFLATLYDVIKESEDAEIEYFEIDSDWKELDMSFLVSQDFYFKDQIDFFSRRLKEFI